MNQPHPCTPHTHSNNSADDNLPNQPRMHFPNRSGFISLPVDALLEPDHPARQLWHFVGEHLDLEPLIQTFKTRTGRQGRTPFAPHTLITLWIYALSEGITSGRQLARLCRLRLDFWWICGDRAPNYHTLDRFRARQGPWLQLQIQRLVALMQQDGLIDLEDEPVGQDGMRVRACAGSGSFRSPQRLQQLAQQAHQHAQEIGVDPQAPPPPPPSGLNGQQAAAHRHARERCQRVQQAQAEAEKVRQTKEARKAGDGKHARASTTDPQARKMKMGDSGYRPAYNVQFATTLTSLVIVGVAVSNAGSDAEEAEAMLTQVEEQHAVLPESWLADGGFTSKGNIEAAAEAKVTWYSPVRDRSRQEQEGTDPYAPKKGDSVAMKEWRQRMATPEAQQLYRERGKCEFPNAYCRNHSLGQLRLRGQEQVLVEVSWYVLAYNWQRYCQLRRAWEQRERA
jgi:transposase